MKKYISYFRMWLVMGLQYRAAAFGGVITQFFWGFMEIIAMHAFHESNPASYPMTMEATCSYIWFQQAFIAMLSARLFDGQILESVRSGNIAYELCRPVHIYDLWFSRSTASRLSGAGLRCIPILIVAVFLPKSYRLSAPAGPVQFAFFLLTLVLAVLVSVSYIMLIYISGLYTISADGFRRLCSSMMDFLTGGYIPLPFFPAKIRQVLELLPFASMQNVPLRIYSGDLAGTAMYRAIGLQLFWLAAMVAAGRVLCRNAERKLMVQGG
ncbi:MAG: ABC transporter permease [Lachnospiraceae bacterium]|nr:ABC transporter permease [Lachnospiraceae bacterium]